MFTLVMLYVGVVRQNFLVWNLADLGLGSVSYTHLDVYKRQQAYNGYKVYWEDGAQIVEPQASGIVGEVNNVDIFNDIKMVAEDEARAVSYTQLYGDKRQLIPPCFYYQ